MTSVPTSAAQASELAAAGIAQAVAALDYLTDSGQLEYLRSALVIAEGATRRIDAASTRTIAAGRRSGVFTVGTGYRSDVSALSDLLQWDRGETKRRIAVADAVVGQVSITGELLPPPLEATAKVFASGGISRRHVEALAQAFDTDAARRVPADDLAIAEQQLAADAHQFTPYQLGVVATDVITTLDQDGPEPDDRDPGVNEVRIVRRRDGGGSITGRFDDAGMFGDILAVLDAKAAPTGAADQRSTPQRHADALHEVCAYVLDHDHEPVQTSGRRPQVTVIIELADLEARARRTTPATGSPPPSCGGTPATPTSSRSCSTAPDNPSTSAASNAWCPNRCAARSPPGIAAAPTRDATDHRAGRSATTSSRGNAAARPRSGTWSCCAGTTTAPSTSTAGRSPSPPTGDRSSDRPPGSIRPAPRCRP